ncbi:TIGR04086 family membrane protein [Anaeromassilibacillus senegalensis]|uniref:TIGR04086 family membrane protein n=1 Tax=Anaeromassilibacillus senegalensis TaxID=1673717 RepID=UPI000681D413|nr:TIGR04086 family membrane protein [Anaeromassilibacillus senegalensis]
MKTTRSSKNNAVLGALRSIVIGSVVGAVLCAVLLAACAFGFVQAKHIPQFAIDPIIIAVSALSSFVAGYIAARMSKKNGLVLGALSGLFLFLLFLLAGVIALHEAFILSTLTRLAVMVLGGAIGGLIAVSKKSKIK